MIETMTAAILSALLAQAPAEARQNRAPQSDQTVPATRGMRLAIDNFAGEVVIHAWEKEAIRVQARHTSAAKISISNDANVVTVTADSQKHTGSIDYDISAPGWMAIRIEGQYDYVSVEGVQGELSIETVRGDIVLKNVGSAIAKTIEGEIQIDGARGKLTLSSVNEDIKVAGATGEVAADTTNGQITLTRMEATSVEVATVNGDVAYEGTLSDRGRYSFTNHNGDVELSVPDTANATFNVRTYNGEFTTSLPVKGPDPSQVRRGRRIAYTLGNGSADVELESFGGDIKLRRAGAARTRKD